MCGDILLVLLQTKLKSLGIMKHQISTGCEKFSLKEKCGRINDAAINLICVF